MSALATCPTLTPPLVHPVLLLGSKNLQTGVLANVLSERLHHTCRQINWEDLHEPLSSDQLLLIDCNSSPAQTIDTLFAALNQSTPNFRAALFNTTPNSPHEELAQWPHLKGIFYQDTNQDQLVFGLHEIINNGHWLSRRITKVLLDKYRHTPQMPYTETPLTKKEQEILRHLLNGSTNQQIATVIHVSEHTVKSHLYNIFKKIKVKNRLQACNWSKEYLS